MTNGPVPDTESAGGTQKLGSTRRGALIAFRVLGLLTLAAGVFQIVLAGLGAFGASFDTHRMLGGIIGIATIVLLILMLIARPSRSAVVMAVLLPVLAFGLQPVLANLGDDNDAWFGGLHALNGLVILGVLGRLTGMAAAETRSAPSTTE